MEITANAVRWALATPLSVLLALTAPVGAQYALPPNGYRRTTNRAPGAPQARRCARSNYRQAIDLAFRVLLPRRLFAASAEAANLPKATTGRRHTKVDISSAHNVCPTRVYVSLAAAAEDYLRNGLIAPPAATTPKLLVSTAWPIAGCWPQARAFLRIF